MNSALIIRDLRESTASGYTEISAEVDGDRVFFRAPMQFELKLRAEPFLGIALIEAMTRNVDIKVNSSIPLSQKLYMMLPELQAIYACWNPDMHKISIHADIHPYKDAYERVASFYSGGVDGSHALYRHITEITHLIMLSEFEVEGNTPDSWRQGVQKHSAFARSIGKELIPLENNVKQWADQRKIQWEFVQGLILSSMGPLLKSRRIYIASSHTYNELFPWGSHPLTDPLWSTESTQVIHDGAGFRRSEKIWDLCHNQKILDNLRVCWQSNHENCGECSKCVRTMLVLNLLGASSQALPELNDLAKLRILRKIDESGETFIKDMMILAKNAKNKTVQRILRRYYRRYKLREAIIMLDRYLLTGLFRRIYRRVKNPYYLKHRVSLTGRKSTRF